MRLAIASLAFCLLAGAIICAFLAVVFFVRADQHAGLSDEEQRALADGRWWEAIPYTQRIPSSTLLSPKGQRLRRTAIRWLLAAAAMFAALGGLMFLVRYVVLPSSR